MKTPGERGRRQPSPLRGTIQGSEAHLACRPGTGGHRTLQHTGVASLSPRRSPAAMTGEEGEPERSRWEPEQGCRSWSRGRREAGTRDVAAG